MPSEKILGGPVLVYIGDEGATPPAPAVAPSASDWTLLGEQYYTEDGVRINETETREFEYTLNTTLPVDSFITQEMKTIMVDLMDATLETMASLRNLTTTVVAATGVAIGTIQMMNKRGFDNSKHALLLRGYAPYALTSEDIGDMVYYYPRVAIDTGERVKRKRAEVLPVTFTVEEHATLAAGYVIAKNAEQT